jgi:TatD DNase family protein
MLELIDTHCHLNYDYAPKTEADLVREAVADGISHLVTIGVDIASVPVVQAISERHPNVYHTIGIHPHEAITMKDGDIALLEQAAKHPKCRGIGEIGLDYHYDHSPREVQIRCVESQLELAARLQLPVIVHSREGEQDLLDALTRYAKSLAAGTIPGIIHCFTGTREFGQACLDLGFFISFSGILTFKTAEALREAAAAFPLEKILVETDSPYLAPIPYRGKKCEPAMVRQTAMKLAEVKGISLEEVARATTENARKVFKIQ